MGELGCAFGGAGGCDRTGGRMHGGGVVMIIDKMTVATGAGLIVLSVVYLVLGLIR